MAKTSRLFSFLIAGAMIASSLAPAAFAHNVPQNQPLSIKSAEVYASDYLRLLGTVEVCSNNPVRTRFTLKAVNTDINAEYSRNMIMTGSGCQDFTVRFEKDFSSMTRAGDEVIFSLREVRNGGDYKRNEWFSTIVEDKSTNVDHVGGDGTYTAEEEDFLIHTPTGLRIRVVDIERRHVDLLVTNIQWGNVKKVRVFVGGDKEIVANDEDHTRVTITNEVSTKRTVDLRLES